MKKPSKITVKTKLHEGQKVYYSEGLPYGTIVKILKRDCRMLLPNGKKENRQISMIEKMVAAQKHNDNDWRKWEMFSAQLVMGIINSEEFEKKTKNLKGDKVKRQVYSPSKRIVAVKN